MNATLHVQFERSRQRSASNTFSGQANPRRKAQRALRGVFDEAKIPDGHAHRFRDTLAVGLLRAGLPIGRVSALLGDSSIKVTDQRNSRWPRARQQHPEAGIRWSWEGSQLRSETGSIMWGGPRRVAERVGFEPTSRFLVNTLSKRAPSATRTPLRDRWLQSV